MRRAGIAASLVCVVMLCGCNEPEQGLELTSSYIPPPDTTYSYEPTTTESSGWTDYDSTYAAQDTPSIGGERTHVVKRKDTLYSLSRKYYGDNSGWKKIYAANQSKISDPNKISVGMELTIP